MDDLETLRYPVGRMPRVPDPLDAATRAMHVSILSEAPAQFRALAVALTPAQIDRPYRPGGWTLRQVFHHVPDSHMQAYIRMKWAVTEDSPHVKTYDEVLWASLPEASTAPIEISLALLEALHARWVAFLDALPEPMWRRTFQHPEWGLVTIDESVTMYSWHSRHHAAHLQLGLRQHA
jgi:hypothetical protein